MDSSPEMEGFGVSEADYEYMFDPLKRRHTSSKKQQIYGVFASDSDSDAEESGMGTKASIRKRKNANYSGPITFVSGGIKVFYTCNFLLWAYAYLDAPSPPRFTCDCLGISMHCFTFYILTPCFSIF